MFSKLASIAAIWLAGAATLAPAMAHAQGPPSAASRPAAASPQDAESKPEASDADSLALRQQQIADRFKHLEAVLLRMSELTRSSDPHRASVLKKAVAQSKEQLIGVQLESLIELLKKDELARAAEGQDQVSRDLKDILELLLSENRAQRIESEKARIREYLRQLNQILRQQKGIQGRTVGGGDPKSLAKDQSRLAEKTGDLAQDIQRNEEDTKAKADSRKPQGEPNEHASGVPRSQGEPKGESKPKEKGKGEGQAEGAGHAEAQQEPSEGGNPARRRLEAARQRMREAQKKLEEAERAGAADKQEEAIRELEEAKADLEKILRQLREEEIERTLAMLESRFAKMLQMQRDVYEGTVRLDKVPEADRTHSHEIESGRLSSKEAEIVTEADKALALLQEDGTALAFPEALQQARADMEQIVDRLGQFKVDVLTQTIEQEVLASLEEMLSALKKAMQQQQRHDPRDQPAADPQDPPLVDVLSEIKMIRTLQMRVNLRTERYSKMIQGEQAENADLIEALGKLAERQQRIYEITRDLHTGKNR